jgi:hypothetical protein
VEGRKIVCRHVVLKNAVAATMKHACLRHVFEQE